MPNPHSHYPKPKLRTGRKLPPASEILSPTRKPISQKKRLTLTGRGKAVAMLGAAAAGFGISKGIERVRSLPVQKSEISQQATQDFINRMKDVDMNVPEKFLVARPVKYVELPNDINHLPTPQCIVSERLINNFNNYATQTKYFSQLKTNLEQRISAYKNGHGSENYAARAQTMLIVLPTAFELCRQYSQIRGFTPEKLAEYFEMFVKRILTESNGNWQAVSKTGALGITQIMPSSTKMIRRQALADKNFPFRDEIIAKISDSISTANLRTLLKNDLKLNMMLSIAHDEIISHELEIRRKGSSTNFNNLLSGYYRGGPNARINQLDPYATKVTKQNSDIR
ncbi:MAG: lytic transglycosylase domain-containing protein [Candidatus Diapherotrites archaeon]